MTEKPFSLNADPRFLYRSPSHATTFENLVAGIRRREGLLVLTGEIGTGKTMMCRAVLQGLGRKTFSSFVLDPFASREDLLKTLLIDFGVIAIEDLTNGNLKQASRTELSYLLAGFFESLTPLEAFAVVIIDEAQNMSLPLIEETRILADSFGSKGHLQIIFVGQPELHAKLKLPEMRQVDQRVYGYNRLSPLDRDTVAGYVEHRLHVAGLHRGRVLFPPDVLDILHRRSGGVPRLINRICDRSLHLAHLRQASAVNRETLETALLELGPATLTPTWDAIMSPEADVVARPAATPVVPVPPWEAPEAADAKPEAPATPAEEEDFSKLIDEWASQDLPTSRKSTTRQEFAVEPVGRPAPPPRPALLRDTAVRREIPSRSAWSDGQGQLRSETYLQRLARVWGKRLAIAVVAIAALNAVVVGISMVPGMMAGVTSAELPALPAPPAPAVLTIAPPVAPASAPPVTHATPAPPVAAPIEAATPPAPGDYLVVVGLFADRARADRLVAELAQAGLEARQRPFQLRSHSVQQVVLGPFANRSDADAQMQRLRQLGGPDDARVVGATSY